MCDCNLTSRLIGGGPCNNPAAWRSPPPSAALSRQPIWSPSGATQRYVRNRGIAEVRGSGLKLMTPERPLDFLQPYFSFRVNTGSVLRSRVTGISRELTPRPKGRVSDRIEEKSYGIIRSCPRGGRHGLVLAPRGAPPGSAGHEAIAVDLPGDDRDAGLAAYADIVIHAIAERSDVILVAQSLAGFTVPLVCARSLCGCSYL